MNNADTLGKVGEAVDEGGDEEVCLIGGDFNMSPAQIVDTEFDRRIGATVFYPETDRGTFRTVRARSTIDYFLISDRAAAAIDEVRTIEASGIKGHVPVQMVFKPKLAALQALHLRMPPRLGTERVYGPLPPPLDWALPRAAAELALAAARVDAADVGDRLEKAYAMWANKAEEELEQYTGSRLAKRGERSKRPKLVWRSVMPEKRHQVSFPTLAATVWLRGKSSELHRITGIAQTECATEKGQATGPRTPLAWTSTRAASTTNSTCAITSTLPTTRLTT